MTAITNGKHNGAPKIVGPKTGAPKVWETLVSRILPSLEPDAEFWWQLTGYHLAIMVEAAGYTPEQQYDTLLFHYHWIVPRLGPAPDSEGRPRWKSLGGSDGSPLEYSWKWNTSGGAPDVRYGWEASNSISGTALDPLSHSASIEFMHQVKKVLPNVDFTWAHHFRANIFHHDFSKYMQEFAEGVQPTTTFGHGIEYGRKGVGLKSYFLPRGLVNNENSLELWNQAITKLTPHNPGRDSMMAFLDNHPEGKFLKPVVLGMDNVTPSKSRLKIYFTTPHTSFKSLREIMTMGGLIDIPESSMQDLRALISAVLCIPGDYPEDKEIPSERPAGAKWAEFEALVDGYVYFLDIAPGNAVPEVKFYLPTRRYGPDDLSIANGVIDWLKARGRGAYTDAYMQMLEDMARHRGLGNGKGMHTYISYQFSKHGEPDIKSYLCPEAYHPARYTRAA